jgi:hypothetical protein
MGAKKLTAENSQFSWLAPTQFSNPGEGSAKTRKFTGVAYSGGVIWNHYYWGDVVFELSSISLGEQKLPALVEHHRLMRCGYSTALQADNATGLTIEGVLLSNEDGAKVAKDSDEGFPWQMSVHITPSVVMEVMAGTSVEVNGKLLQGPLTVFKNSKIIEVSFTATGWDSDTSATAMNRSGTKPPTLSGDPPMTPEEKAAQDKLAADNAALIAQLAQFSKANREANIKLLFADTGREYKAEDADVVELAAMDDAAFNATAKFSRAQYAKAPKPEQKPDLPAGMFSHQATGGRTAEGGTATPQRPGLVATAKARAAEFSRTHPTQH